MRLGLHVLTKAGNQLYGIDGPERQQHVEVWRHMGVTDVKLVTDGDSQLKAAKWLVSQGFRVLVRFYHVPIATEAVPDDQLRLFRDVGVREVEGYTNEPEVEWSKPPSVATIDMLAKAHIRFADACGRVGVIPLTPAIQGDRVMSWFAPMVDHIIALDRRDALLGSIIGCHPRPVNNLPDTAPPGFVPRSYEIFDDVLIARLGVSLPIWATEWGYEPGDAANNELPRIDTTLHAAYNVRLAQMTWRPCLEVCHYWTWLNDWFDSGWWRGDVNASLPVVRAFIEMAKPAVMMTPEMLRAIGQRKPSEISLNPDAALYKAAQAATLGQAETSEWKEQGWIVQKFQHGVAACPDGLWDQVKTVKWV